MKRKDKTVQKENEGWECSSECLPTTYKQGPGFAPQHTKT